MSLGDFVVGPRVVADGTPLPSRLGRDGSQIVQDGHGRYYEQASRGLLFSISTALAGTTLVAGNVAPPAAAAATVLSLLNPPGSGFNLEILLGWLLHISGTPGAGAWAWCGGQAIGATRITAAGNVTPSANNIGNALPPAIAFTQTALTGGPAHFQTRLFPSSQFAAIIAATTPGQVAIDDVGGAIVVPPGALLTLAPPAVGTTHIVAAGIMFALAPTLIQG